MRILIVSHQFSTSGASLSLLRLTAFLQSAGHAITLVALDLATGPLLDGYAALGIAPTTSMLDLGQIDVCIGNTIVAAGAALRIGPHVPFVWWIRETDVGLRILQEKPERAGAFAQAAAIVFETEFQRDTVYGAFTRSIDATRLHVLPNPVSSVADADAATVAPAKGLRIVSVGTVEPRKRHVDLVCALALLRRRDLELVICGRLLLPAETLLAGTTPDAGRVHLTGDLPRTACLSWVASADIVCHPSASESQSLIVMEAAALGKPLLLSDLPCHGWLFRNDENAMMFPVGDVAALARGVARLADEPALRTRLGAAAAASVAPFDEPNFFARFAAVLSDAAQTRAARLVSG